MVCTFNAALLLASLVVPGACVTNTGDGSVSDGDDGDETMYQVSTLQALLDGGYDGRIAVGELRRHGDIGVGTFDRIDGEMIVLDGTVYQARHDGSVCVADDDVTVPFANVTFFASDVSVTLPKVACMDDMTSQMNAALCRHGLSYDQIYVARMEVEACDSIHVRSELPQHKPYRPLPEVLKTDQREFTYHDIGGTIVAVFFPDSFSGLNSPGWHLHFLSSDGTKGGHVFDIATSGCVTVHIDVTPYFHLNMAND